MKQIIFPEITDCCTITFEELTAATPYPLIGFHTEEGKGEKGTLVPEGYMKNHYFARAFQGWGRGNGWECTSAKTIKEWVAFFRSSRKTKFYCFDSPKELFKWLSE